MGKGGRSSTANNKWGNAWVSTYDPADKSIKLPTKGQVKACIPKECFKRSAIHSFYYVFQDTAMAAALVYATSQVLSTDLPKSLLSLDAMFWVFGWTFYAFWMEQFLPVIGS